MIEIYSGKLKLVDALIPDAEKPTELNIWPFLPKFPYVAWLSRIFRLIVKQNQSVD